MTKRAFETQIAMNAVSQSPQQVKPAAQESSPNEKSIEIAQRQLELAIDALVERWKRNFTRPRHRKVLKERAKRKRERSGAK